MQLVSLVLTAMIVLPSFLIGGYSIAGAASEQTCDVDADYFLGVEDYTEAIRRQSKLSLVWRTLCATCRTLSRRARIWMSSAAEALLLMPMTRRRPLTPPDGRRQSHLR